MDKIYSGIPIQPPPLVTHRLHDPNREHQHKPEDQPERENKTSQNESSGESEPDASRTLPPDETEIPISKGGNIDIQI
jgi:hypothetical protein